MVAVSAGSATDKVIISDHATPASGVFWIGLNPEKIMGPIKQPLTAFVNGPADQSFGTHVGDTIITFNFENCHYPKDGTGGDWEKFIRALGYWAHNDNNTLLYLSIPDKDAYNIAKWGVAGAAVDFATVGQIRGKVAGAPQVDWGNENNYYFNLQFVRLTN
ncbi:MAG: hypothetical protein MUO31_00995 [Thermodesulfovibrionales bacterium]|nr:hypothetical protein [Thermodesulfovibrionales bacterium]